MVKSEHFSDYSGGFKPMSYLVDTKPNKYVNNESEYVHNSKDLQVSDLINYCSSLGCEFKPLITNSWISSCGEAIFYISTRDKKNSKVLYLMNLYYTEDFKHNEKIHEWMKDVAKPVATEKLPEFHLVTIGKEGPSTLTKKLKTKVEIDETNSYNLDYDLPSLIETLNDKTSGLIIFAGDPGTGKSTLIKYLAQSVEKKFFFINNSNLSILSDPNFTTYCLEELEGAVLVLEDCERAMLSRDVNKSFDISNILNITDGIIGDMLNMKIIATLNTHDKIDSALLRKGRLIRKVEFKKLRPDQVAAMATKLNKSVDGSKEMTLCEIYNLESNGVETVKKGAIGFTKE